MTDHQYVPEILHAQGVQDLISVSPPNGQISPTSKLSKSAMGKSPARRLANGLYIGYDWRRAPVPTIEQVRGWIQEGSNVGLRAGRFPGVDIDCKDALLAGSIELAALALLGPAPVRFGNAPKRLLMYSTDKPFTRLRLRLEKDEVTHMVEILGEGQQYLVYGIHPATKKHYDWNGSLSQLLIDGLTEIDREQALAFLQNIKRTLEADGWKATISGDGQATKHATPDQAALLAPSLEALTEAVMLIPNEGDWGYDEWIKLGYAIKAAAGEANEREAFHLWADWSALWPGEPQEDIERSWLRVKGEKRIGWSWIAETARAHGFNDAAIDFEATGIEPPQVPSGSVKEEITAIDHSDQWCSDRVVKYRGAEIRYCAHRGWLVWNGWKWKTDDTNGADSIILVELRKVANIVGRTGSTDAEKKANLTKASLLCSAYKASAVRTVMQADRTLAVTAEALDFNPWILNTPTGIVDLKTGKLGPSQPGALCTMATAEGPDFSSRPVRWFTFLEEATGNDRELQKYLQKLAGYYLTGSVIEHQISFFWGPGGNGKGTFLNALQGMLGDYAQTATMETFTESQNERHSTDVARMAGARMVLSSETTAGKKWDSAKLKSLSGGDRITARFMRQDNFEYKPQFKLCFMGNHKPSLRSVDDGIRRRFQLVPFTVKPKVKDIELGDKLAQEYGAILAWAIEGCLAWQREGLTLPPVVQDATAEYFRDEDTLVRWLEERTESTGGYTPFRDLYRDFLEWCGENEEGKKSNKSFAGELKVKGIDYKILGREKVTNYALSLKPRNPLEGMTA